MQQRDAKICFITVLLHLLLLRSFGFISDIGRVLYIIVYIASYYIPIFILAGAVKPSCKRERVKLNDIRLTLLYFITMVGFSSIVSLIFKNDALEISLTQYTFVLSAILAPISEELLWRHGVYRILSHYGFIPAAFISSLLFALMHTGTAGLCYAFFSGIIFCILYELTKSPILPILLHIFNNSLSLISAEFPIILPIAFIAVCAASFVLGFFAKERRKLDFFSLKYGIFKDGYLYLTVAAFILLRFAEA